MSQVERESKVQERAMKIIRKHGGYVYKNAQNMYTEKGRPDLTACIPVSLETLVKYYGKDSIFGLFVGIELKRPGQLKGVSTAQEIVGRQIINAKGIWLLVDNTDSLEQFINELQGDTNVI